MITGALARAARGAGPGCFAMVMATGIVSAALRQERVALLPAALLAIAAAGMALLLAGSAVRAAAFPADLRADLACPGAAFTWFAVVAACVVLGDLLAGDGRRLAAAVLAGAALTAYLALTFLVPVRLAARRPARPRVTEVNGTWYLWVVGTQSLAITAAFLQAGGLLPAGPAALAAITAWSAGILLYLAVTVLVAVRLLAAPGPGDAVNPYWVAMGAASITVLAAAAILQIPGPPVAAARDVITGLAVTFWGLATGLIPLLAAATAARYLRRPVRARYRPDAWTVVFPLGMYATAGLQLGTAARLPPVHHVGAAAAWPAAAAWALTFTAMAASPFSRRRRGEPREKLYRGTI